MGTALSRKLRRLSDGALRATRHCDNAHGELQRSDQTELRQIRNSQMRSNKRYTNTTFTKRVDHGQGLRPFRHPVEPCRCADCGAVYSHQRWANGRGARDREEASSRVDRLCPGKLCSACLRQRRRDPRGYVYLAGDFLKPNLKEIEARLRNEAARASRRNPLTRIMGWDSVKGEGITITTTTEQLAHRLGHVLQKTFGGSVRYVFSHENKLARVWWRRD